MWQIVTVSEIAAPKRNAIVGGPFGSNLVSADYVKEGVPVIRGQNMGQGRWVQGEFVFVSLQKAEDLAANLAGPGDLVLTQRGTLGQVALVPQGPHERYVVSQSQMKLSVNSSVACPLFLYYLFSSQEQIQYIKSSAIQTGVPHINLGHLKSTRVNLPPLVEQQDIARVLGSLDDQIELYQRMNQTLEAMASAIFKSWFVEFEPTDGYLSCPWESGIVGGLARIQREILSPAEYDTEQFSHYSIPAFDDGMIPKMETGRSIRSNKFIVPKGAVLLSKLNPRIPRIWLPTVADKSRAICSTEFIVVVPNTDLDREFLYSLFCSREFMERFAARITGTSGSHQRVRPEDLLRMSIAVPSTKARERYSTIVGPLLLKVAQNRAESQTLASLRDTLLPKLLSGELRVKQAEKIVGLTV